MARNFKLEYIGNSTTNTPTDISDSVQGIEKFSRVGTGEIQSVSGTLNTRFGDFIIKNNAIREDENDPTTAIIIKPYDLFRVTMGNRLGIAQIDDSTIIDTTATIHTKLMIQDDNIPQNNENSPLITLELMGRERFLQKMFFPGHFYYYSMKLLIQEIVLFYNRNKGENQPTLSVTMENIPENTYATFDFQDQTTCYDALMDIVKRLSLSVSGGGGGQFYGLLFKDGSDENVIPTPTNLSHMTMTIKPVGTPDNITQLDIPITMSKLSNPQEGNIVVVRGQQGSGTLPVQIAQWRSLIEEYENLPLWEDNISYPIGSYIKAKSITQSNSYIFKKVADGTHGGDLTIPAPQITSDTLNSWEYIPFNDYIQERAEDVFKYEHNSTFEYSPWTHNKIDHIKNWFGNDGTNLSVTDCNVIVRDKDCWRTGVDFRLEDNLDDIPNEYKYSGTSEDSETYHGMKILCDSDPFTINSETSDKFGKSYTESIIMQDRDGDWIVFREAKRFDKCAVLSERKVYEYNVPFGRGGIGNARDIRNIDTDDTRTLGWEDSSTVLLGNDCFHTPSTIENSEGLITAPDNFDWEDNDPLNTFTTDSAVKIEYNYSIEGSVIDTIIKSIFPLVGIIKSIVSFFQNSDNDDEYLPDTRITDSDANIALYDDPIYNIGWWTTLFETPFPKSTEGLTDENVGGIFGGTKENKVAVLDLNNRNITFSGQTGYGKSDSNSLDPLDGIKLILNFDIYGLDVDSLHGDIPFRMTIEDLFDNVWTSDINYRFQGDRQELNFPLSGFGIFRARTPIAYTISKTITRILNPELKITEIFERRLVKRIKLQCMLGHDDQGRYDPITWNLFLRTLISSLTTYNVTFRGVYDAVHFTKTPLAIAKDYDNNTNPSLHLMTPIKSYPQVSNVVQLQNIANSELTLAKIVKERWTIKADDFIDVGPEETIEITNKNFIATPTTNDEDFKAVRVLKEDGFVPETGDNSVEEIAIEDSNGRNEGETGYSETLRYIKKNTQKLIISKNTYSIGNRTKTSGMVSTLELYRRVPPRGR